VTGVGDAVDAGDGAAGGADFAATVSTPRRSVQRSAVVM
jgi:hypothetical protein